MKHCMQETHIWYSHFTIVITLTNDGTLLSSSYKATACSGNTAYWLPGRQCPVLVT